MDLRTTINTILLPSGVFIGFILAIGLTSMAEDSELDTGPRAVPYNGILEFNGSPLNGQADLRFTLTDVPGGEGANCLFEEEHDNVSAYAGRFAVNIGSVVGDLPDCVFDSDAMYIEVGVRNAESAGDYVALTGAQRIHPVPFSYWAAEGSDFTVDGNIAADSATITGDISANTATIGGSATIAEDVSASTATISDSATITGDVLTGSAANETHEGSAFMRVIGGGGDRPVLWAGQFTVDSEDGSGLLNLVAGSHSASGNSYAYNSGRGSVRLQMDDAKFGFFLSTDDDRAEGDTVNWTESFRVTSTGITNPAGDLSILDNLDITGDIQDSNSNEVTISDGLNVTNNTTIGSDGSGNLTVNGDVTVTGTANLGIVIRESGSIGNNGTTFFQCDEGEVVLGGGATAGSNNNEGIRHSYPLYRNSRWGWAVQCHNTNGSLRTCTRAYVICARIGDAGTAYSDSVGQSVF
ncbi:MAG: polymer-forming cytoskeletal protein [Myxococcota bacterium]